MSKDTVVSRSVAFIRDELTKTEKRPLIVGFSGPQGSGKTTNCTEMTMELKKDFNIVQFSMDDFYLTHAEQLKVQQSNSDDWMLSGRGLPGTHDLELLTKVLKQLQGNVPGDVVQIPSYDKSKFKGLGDRSADFEEVRIDNGIDVVLFEGWFNGYVYIPSNKQLLEKWQSVQSSHNTRYQNGTILNKHILNLNNNLKLYFKIWELFDLFICVRTPRIETVFEWRTQQEHQMIKEKGCGMSDEDVVKFVDRYMPLYYLYYDRLQLMINMRPSLSLEIDESRCLIK